MGFFSKILGKKTEEQPVQQLDEQAELPVEDAAGIDNGSAGSAEPAGRPSAQPSAADDAGAGSDSGLDSALESGSAFEPVPSGGTEFQAPEQSGSGPESGTESESELEPRPEPEPESEPAPASELGDAIINKDEFILKLRSARPTPGGWLEVALDGLDAVDAVFWRRLEFLFESLETPVAKSEAFIAELKDWLAQMDFTRPAQFASELQFRLAIVLGMENDAEEKKRFLAKLWAGLARARERISGGLRELFSSGGELDAAFWESLEEVLISSDVGYEASMALVEQVRAAARKAAAKTRSEARDLLQAELERALAFPPRIQAANPPEIVLMVGVNGAGKTTTIAKLAYREHLAGKKVLIAAGDTFRAAAVEQLAVWAKRVGAGFYSKSPGANAPADPAAVAYEAVGKALSENYDIVFIDTAGRLQTKTGLMEELGKIVRVLAKRHPGAPHRTILVLDATTGQNALSQAKLFSETSSVSEIIISKLDGTAKAGVAVGVAMQYKIPITFIGLGEKMEDLRPFDGAAFAGALLD